MSTPLDIFLAREMQRYNLRISPRGSPYERTAQYVRLMMERQGQVLDETDVEVVSNMILLRYSMGPVDPSWVDEMLDTQLTEWFGRKHKGTGHHPNPHRSNGMVTRSMAQRYQ
jgi:hypothetical protein